MIKINSPIIFTILSIVALLIYASCGCSEGGNSSTDYTMMISPKQSIYQRGDTIRLHANFDSKLYYEPINSEYDNANMEVQFLFSVFFITPNNKPPVRVGRLFPIETEHIVEVDSDARIRIISSCDETSCSMDINIILESEGYFCLSLGSMFIKKDYECYDLFLAGEKFDISENNFEICQEINTTQFEDLGNFHSSADTEPKFYFFKVE